MDEQHGERLPSVDATFLEVESETLHRHVGGLFVFDPPADDADAWSFPRFVELVRSRLHLLPRYRRKLATPPLGLGHPVWIDDPEFDLGYHVRHAALPAPGTTRQLAEYAARIMSRRLDRSRPLWELYVIEGLEDGRFALLDKSHLAVVDGVAGMDIASGLHNRLTDEPELVAAAKASEGALHDVRVPERKYPIGDGAKRRGKRMLAVGTDCSCGKMYTALAMEKAMREAGRKASFRATGQTGILITGDGVPLDAVVADFMAGSIEWLTPDNDDDHWDLVEGQGSIFHPSFSGVTMALVHGSQADALILCHEPTRTHMRGLPHYDVPSLEELAEQVMPLARRVNPDVRIAGCAINTAALSDEDAEACVRDAEQRLGVPAVDPYRHGAARLAEAL